MIRIVIPARLGSTRLPGKALLSIAGQPMVWHVWQRALAVAADSVVVATDDARIAAAFSAEEADVVMTRADHPSGTDRLAEVVAQRDWSDDDIIVNLQGDEPLMPPENLEQVAALLAAHPDASIATLCEPITSRQEFLDPSAVKVVTDQAGRALYFSRAPIPYPRDRAEGDEVPGNARRHIGLYAYRAAFLRRFPSLTPSELERLESLEQLRALAAGETIMVADARCPVPGGVDTEHDLARVCAQMEGDE